MSRINNDEARRAAVDIKAEWLKKVMMEEKRETQQDTKQE